MVKLAGKIMFYKNYISFGDPSANWQPLTVSETDQSNPHLSTDKQNSHWKFQPFHLYPYNIFFPLKNITFSEIDGRFISFNNILIWKSRSIKFTGLDFFPSPSLLKYKHSQGSNDTPLWKTLPRRISLFFLTYKQ